MKIESLRSRAPLVWVVTGVFAPERLSRRLADADMQAELQRNAALRSSSDAQREEAFGNLHAATRVRLQLMRRRLLVSWGSMGSAVLSAYVARHLLLSGVPVPALGVASILVLSAATLGRIGWAGQSISGETTVERGDQALFHLLYWIGTFCGAAAIL